MSHYADTCDCHLRQILLPQHRTAFTAGDSHPVHSALYMAGPQQRALERDEVDKMFMEGVLEPAMPEWASLAVFAADDYESLHICVGYHRFDAILVRDNYNIPRVDECIASLGQAKTVSTLDANFRVLTNWDGRY